MDKDNWVVRTITRRLGRMIYEIYSSGAYYPYNLTVEKMIYDRIDDKVVYYERRALVDKGLTGRDVYKGKGYE